MVALYSYSIANAWGERRSAHSGCCENDVVNGDGRVGGFTSGADIFSTLAVVAYTDVRPLILRHV